MDRLDKVCGVLVAYNPDENILGTIINACFSLNSTIVVDNSTDPFLYNDLKIKLEAIQLSYPSKKIIIIKNETNLGLPISYNKAVSLASDLGFDSVLLLDQDSLISKDSLITLLNDRSKLIKLGIRVGAMGMYHLQNFHTPIDFLFNGKFRWRDMYYEDCIQERRTLINSGILISILNYQYVKGYNKDFFLDNSDLEFSLRLRKKGLKLFESMNSKMLHNFGESHSKKFVYTVPYRDPKREYYTRDLVRCLKLAHSISRIDYSIFLILIISKLIGTLLFKTNRKERFHYILSGLKDGLKYDSVHKM